MILNIKNLMASCAYSGDLKRMVENKMARPGERN